MDLSMTAARLAEGEGARRIRRVEITAAGAEAGWDLLAREEPLEVRVAGVPIAVVMRTPGHDEELVRGFLRTEGIVQSAQDVARIAHCSVANPPEAEDNVVQVQLRPGLEIDLLRFQRQTYASSSCGLCGKQSIERVMQRAPDLEELPRVRREVLLSLPAKLSERQKLFHGTGGLHAAGLFGLDGSRWVVREDVGRHNAVDKVIGWALERERQLRSAILMVSGRVSFEVVQKALMAGIPGIAAISAPSSLAAELALKGNSMLVCFVRGERMCVYCGGERIDG
jgi:FdhD protein